MKRFKHLELLNRSISLPQAFILILAVCVMFFSLQFSVSAQEVVNIPDANLRTVLEKALGKDAGSPITSAEMQTLTTLSGQRTNISDLSGIEAAANLTRLDLANNQISDILPLITLTNLETLELRNNQILDISPLSGLINLTTLHLYNNQLSDISPLSSLTNLTTLSLGNNQLSDISPLSGLINLRSLWLNNNQLSDISPLSGLTNLRTLELYHNQISDISPLTALTNLIFLSLFNNQISDVTPLVGLKNLRTVSLYNNQISDRETLAVLTSQTIVYFSGNPAFETPGPKIEGPWLWTITLTGEQDGSRAASSGRDFLAEATGGAMTEAHIAANGATAGSVVGDSAWTSGTLSPTGNNNLTELVNTLGLGTDINTPVIYGVISVESPREQNTRLFVGNGGGPVKVWLNGESVHVDVYSWYSVTDYRTAFPVTLKQGENRLFVALYRSYSPNPWSGFFGFEDGAEYTGPEPQQTAEGIEVIPDGKLVTVVRETLGLASSDVLTTYAMLKLTKLDAPNRGITDLTGLEHANNLRELNLGHEYVPGEGWVNSNAALDFSPLEELTQLTTLNLSRNSLSDVSALSGLTQLTWLNLEHNDISDVSPLAVLTRLTRLQLYNNDIKNVAPLAELKQLTWLGFSSNGLSDISALAGLKQLTYLALAWNNISDVSALSGLTQLTTLLIQDNGFSDVSALSGLTQLTRLRLDNTRLSDVSALTGLKQLTSLDLARNNISDLSPLAELKQMTQMWLNNNDISDLSPLAGLTQITGINLNNNDISDLSPLTELTQMTGLWLDGNKISDLSPLAGLTQMETLSLKNNSISDVSPLLALDLTGTPRNSTRLHLDGNPLSYVSINTHIPAMQEKGIEIQFDNVAHPALVKISGDVQEGATGEALTTPFVVEVMDEHGSPVQGGPVTFAVTVGSGSLSTTTTITDAAGRAQTTLTLGRKPGKNTVSVTATEITRSVLIFVAIATGEPVQLIEDVNGNGVVNIQDLVLVAANFGETRENPADVNGDGIVNIVDLALVAEVLEKMAAGAPALRASALESLSAADVQHWLRIARQTNLTEPAFQRGIRFLERLLAALTPKETALLPNYPNPFNPETWIPYQLAKPAEVTVAIHTADGKLVRTLALGSQPAGMYQSRSRAAYWNGRNEVDEPVASGIYFYTLTAGEFTATKKMLIRK